MWQVDKAGGLGYSLERHLREAAKVSLPIALVSQGYYNK